MKSPPTFTNLMLFGGGDIFQGELWLGKLDQEADILTDDDGQNLTDDDGDALTG